MSHLCATNKKIDKTRLLEKEIGTKSITGELYLG